MSGVGEANIVVLIVTGAYLISLVIFAAMLKVLGEFEMFPSLWVMLTAALFTTVFAGWTKNKIEQSRIKVLSFSLYILVLFGFLGFVLYALFSTNIFLVEETRRLSASIYSSLIGSVFAVLIGYFALRKEPFS